MLPVRTQWVLVVFRIVVMVPLFVLCATGVIRSDAVLFLLDAALGASNGYIISCVMMRAPHSVPSKQRSTAGMLMVFALMSGLTVGAFVGEGFSLLF